MLKPSRWKMSMISFFTMFSGWRAQHNEVQLFLALFRMHGGNQHTAGLPAHHFPGGQVGDSHQCLADERLGLVVLGNAGENLPVCAGGPAISTMREWRNAISSAM